MYTDKRRRAKVNQYESKRLHLLSVIHDESLPLNMRLIYTARLAALPRAGSKTRIRNRCVLTGRGRGVYSYFRLSRIALRDLASQGLLSGITKSSW